MKIGVSSCLLGHMCRYNSGHAKDDFIVDSLAAHFELVPYCPEAIVFGTPRESIRLVEEQGDLKVHTTKNKVDVTAPLQDICEREALRLANDGLCGFILKSGSPTCGLERVKIYDEQNTSGQKRGTGLFAQQIKNRYPYLPLEEEGRLQDAWLRENFIMQVFAYQHLHDFLACNPSAGELVTFHTSYKYLIYAKSQVSYKSLGNIVANHEKLPLSRLRELYKEEFLKAISKKGTIKKTYNILLHLFGYFKKSISKEEKHEVLASIEEFKEGIIPLITIIKIIKLYVVRFDIEYLKTQKFLTPYPKELALRSSLKAYK